MKLGLEGAVSSSNGFVLDQEVKQKWCGSTGLFRQEKPLVSSHDIINEGFRASKIAKLGDHDLTSASKTPSSFVFSDVGQQQHNNILSFSSPKLQNTTFPRTSSGCSCSGGGGGMNSSMYFVNGVKGPFTPSQWLELEHQAMIYKYIIANEPIPPNLLIPIARALESANFSSFHGGLLRPTSFGWGPFHLGFSNSTDPEPGRCRRTDGKKWRCSRDAVPDQKYCERHMNRGRHRSRKPVEGHPGHSVSGNTTNKTTSTTNLMNVNSSSSPSVVPGASPSNSFAITHNHSKDLQPASRHEFLSPSISLNSSGNTYSSAKEQIPFAESAVAGFGVLTPEGQLNTIQKSSPVYRTYGFSSQELKPHEHDPRQALRPFIDEWPKLQTQSDRTELSISIPVAVPADFMSSTSSPTGEKVTTLSPLRLSQALDSVEMGLGVGIMEQSQKQVNWVPISWETSIGGPLGEALKTTSSKGSVP